MEQNNEWLIGKNALKEGIAAGKRIQKVYLSDTLDNETLKELLKLIRAQKISVLVVPKSKLDRLNRSNHQGVLASISPIQFYKTMDLVTHIYEQGQHPALALLDGITDVHNFGAIARSAEIFGLGGIIIGNRNSAPVNYEAIKSSAGALLQIPVCKENNLLHTVKELKAQGFVVIGADEKAEQTIEQLDMTKPCVMVFGSEGEGISYDLKKTLDQHVKIPQIGKINSLNVSVSAGIFFYEWMKQNNQKK